MRMHHAGISVPDLDRSLAWYCAALGLRPGYQFEVPPLRLRGGFALGDGDTGVELIELAGSAPGVPKTDPPVGQRGPGLQPRVLPRRRPRRRLRAAPRARGGRGLGPARRPRARHADGVRHRPGRQPHRAGRAARTRPDSDHRLVQRAVPARPGRGLGTRRSRTRRSAGSSTSGGRRGGPPPCCAPPTSRTWRPGCGWRPAEGLRVAVRAGGHSWAAWSLREDTLLIDLGGVHRHGLRREDRDRHRRARGARRRSTSTRSSPPAGAVLRRRALPDRRARRVPAAGRDGLELPRLGLGGRVDRRDPGGDRRRRRRVVRRGLERRPVLGGQGVRAGVLRRGHRVPAADAGTVPRAHPDDLRVPAVGGGRGPRLAVRRAARRAAVGRAGRRRHHARRYRPEARPCRARAGGGRGELRRRPRVAARARHLPGRGQGPGRRRSPQPVTIGELRAEQLRANPEGHRYTVDNAYLAGPARRADPGHDARVHRPADGEVVLALVRPRAPARAPAVRRDCPTWRCPCRATSTSPPTSSASRPRRTAACRSWVSDTMGRLAPFSAGCYLGDSDFTVRADQFMSDAAWDRFRRDPRGPRPRRAVLRLRLRRHRPAERPSTDQPITGMWDPR